jgi:LytS/YehU family sensor histidine kinase
MDVDSSILDAAVPHMGLQPLVENAIRHGIAARASGGTIIIEAGLEGETLRLAIKDSGAGFFATQTSPGNDIGLKNLMSRLEQLYSGRAQLIVKDDLEGTSATLLLPYRAHPDVEGPAPLIGIFNNEARVRERIDCR